MTWTLSPGVGPDLDWVHGEQLWSQLLCASTCHDYAARETSTGIACHAMFVQICRVFPDGTVLFIVQYCTVRYIQLYTEYITIL